jgi:hypothetical protein
MVDHLVLSVIFREISCIEGNGAKEEGSEESG